MFQNKVSTKLRDLLHNPKFASSFIYQVSLFIEIAGSKVSFITLPTTLVRVKADHTDVPGSDALRALHTKSVFLNHCGLRNNPEKGCIEVAGG